MFLRSRVLVASAACLCACAAPEVTPIHIAQDGDKSLSCSQLDEQIAANEAAAAQLLHKDKEVERKNTAKVVAGAIPYVGLLVMASTDLSNEEQVKARAIIDRDEWLNYLIKQKGCKQ